MTTYNTEDGGFLVEDNAGNQTIVENDNIFIIDTKDKPDCINWEEMKILLSKIKIIDVSN